MKVIATKTGLDGQFLRHPGDVFKIKDDVNEAGEVIAFSKKWMKKLDAQEQQPQRA